MTRIERIRPADQAAVSACHERWNSIAKPLGSLGLLEKMIERIAGMTGSPDVDLSRRAAVVFCADNGVVSEGVTQSDSSVTAIVAKAVAEGTSNISRMAESFGAEVIPVDVGMNTDLDDVRILRRKTAYGTKNIANGAAMTLEQAEAAICAGMDVAGELAGNGVRILVSGEMGIGNTTTAAAIACVLLDKPPEALAGRGAGLDSAGLKRKISVIRRAIEVNQPDRNRPLELLAKLGGFDIAGMTGLFLGGAVYRVPVVIDGVISAAAAALAASNAPNARDYRLPSNTSEEPAAAGLLGLLKMEAPICAGLRLGEGTGGILLLPLLDGALSVYRSAHRFDDLNMERYAELK